MDEFSGIDALRAGWDTFKRRPIFFVLATLILFVVGGLLSQGIDAAASQSALPVQIAGNIAGLVVQFALSLGYYRITLLSTYSVDEVSFQDAWVPQYIPSFIAGSLLVGIVVALGLAFFIVPGLVLAAMYAFVFYPIAERGLGPIEAMKLSALITRGYRWRVLLFLLLLLLVNVAGLMALFVGLLIAAPVSALAYAHAYRFFVARAATPTRGA
jgi:uncharacterized membrane protein